MAQTIDRLLLAYRLKDNPERADLVAAILDNAQQALDRFYATRDSDGPTYRPDSE